MRVLMLTPWPTRRFLHGGQLRASSIADAYRARGHTVLVRGHYDPASFTAEEYGPDDYPIPPDIERHYAVEDLGSEFRFARGLAATPAIVEAYARAASAFGPDLLQFEEPYLWPLARAVRARLGDVPLLYSAYNFETEAKCELRRAGAAVTDRTLADVAACEAEIARDVQAIAAVSRPDAAKFRALGATRVFVAPNGSRATAPSPGAVSAASAYVGGAPFALFVSSAHPPNALGLIETLRAASGVFFGRGELFVCGEICRFLRSLPESAENRHILSRARLLGMTSRDVLDALYRTARVVVLPKTAGGGSNLKTAEALLSGRPIIATRRAFDGYEEYADAPGVRIEDDGRRFWEAVRNALDEDEPSPDLTRTPHERDGLLWDTCLEPLVAGAESLIGSAAVSALSLSPG